MKKLFYPIKILSKPFTFLFFWKKFSPRNRILFFLGLATLYLAGAVLVIYTFQNITKIDAAWFNDQWAYRTTLTFTNAGSAVTYQKVKFDIDTATLTTDKLQADCGDSRFTDSTGKLLKYYIDTAGGACDGASTDYYVLVPSIIVGSNVIYHYYGNPSTQNGTEASNFSESTFTTGTVTAGTEEKTPGPLAYWEFDEGTGTTANDSSSNSLSGTLNNTPTWQTENMCISGKCLWFDGANNENVSLADNALLDFAAADDFTIQAWIKRNGASSANNFILTKAQAGYTGYKLYQDASGDYCFDVRDGTNTDTACTSAVEFDDDKWHHVTGVKNGTTSLKLYVDGIERASDTSIAATSTLANTGTLYAGVDLDGTFNEWLGFMDEVKVYRYARSDAQIKADFVTRGSSKGSSTLGANTQNLEGALSNGLVGYWKMDEGSANTCTGGVNDNCDSSGNGNDGAWNGNATSAAGKYGNGVTFDGTGDYINVGGGDNSILDIPGAITITTWIKPTAAALSSYHQIMGNANGSTSQYGLYLFNGKLFYAISSSGSYEDYDSSVTLVADTWYHIVATNTGSDTVQIYINGTAYTPTKSGSVTTPTSGFTTTSFGRNGNVDSEYFAGIIDEARIYNRVLSSSEVSQLYNWAPGPMAYWNADNTSGTTVLDSSGNGAPSLTLTNATIKQGKYGKAIDFPMTTALGNANAGTGTTSYLSFRDGDNFTLMAWVYYRGLNSFSDPGSILGKFNCCGNSEYRIRINNSNKLSLSLTDDAGSGNDTYSATSSLTVTKNTWIHVAATFDDANASNINLYINGVQDPSPTRSGTLANIGSFGTSQAFNVGGTFYQLDGRIDETKIYNYVRSQAQVIEDMNAGHPTGGSPVGSQVAYWKLDEGYGSTTNNSVTTGGLSGTITNAIWTNSGKFNKALSFDGSGDYVSIADNNALDITDTITLSAWIKAGSMVQAGTVIGKTNSASTASNYTLRLINQASPDELEFTATTYGSYWTSNANLVTGTWYHVVATYNNATDTTRIYVNGRLTTGSCVSASCNTALTANSEVVGIGRPGALNSEYFNGVIDEVKIYSSDLTPAQVLIDYNRNASQKLGGLGTTAAGASDDSQDRAYCPPGDTTAICAPVGYWSFEEKSGTTANDKSGNNNTGTLTSGPTWTTGKIGSALSFDGTSGSCTGRCDDLVDAGSGTTLDNLHTGDFSFSTWIYPKSGGESDSSLLLSKGAAFSQGWLLMYDNASFPNDLTFYIHRATSYLANVTTGDVLTHNTWQYLTVTYDGSLTHAGVHIYINGKEVTYDAVSQNGSGATVSDAAANLIIGNESTAAQTWDGYIDDLKLYNYDLSNSQIAWDYNRGKPVAHWKMDECQGTTLNDSSGNGLSGTWSGSGGTQTAAGACTTSATTPWYNGRNGKLNSSLNFDAGDDVVTVTNVSKIDLNEGLAPGHTFSGWFYASSDGENDVGRIYDKGTNTYARVSGQSGSNLTIDASLDLATSDATVSVSAAVTTGTWNHIAVAYTDDADDEISVYINGRLRGTSTNGSGAPAADTSNFFLGNNSAGSATFDGQIDDVKIFNYEMSINQIRDLYNSGSVRFAPVTGTP